MQSKVPGVERPVPSQKSFKGLKREDFEIAVTIAV
jgi:hypothetical protein